MGHGKYEKKPDVKKKNAAGKVKKSSNQILLKVMIVVLVLLLLVMVAAAVVMNYVFGKINRYDNQIPTVPIGEMEQFETDPTEEGEETYETVDPDSVVWDTVDEIQSTEGIINILLIGQDARPGETRARSDSMILVSLNTRTNDIKMVSFMRDLYVQIPGGYLDNRINASYAFGGPELLDETLKLNFGVQVDGNVEINFEAFEDVIDILGGVDVELNSEEAGYMNRKGYSASTGMNHFAGDATLVFSRMRYVSDGDYGRTDRQRRVIAAVINSLKDAGLTEIMGLINQILPYVTTDLTNAEIVSYATAGLTALANGGEISSSRIPQNDAHYNASIRGMAVLVPDLKMCQEDLKDFIYSEE